jgi:hypothetical protein
MAGCIRQIDTDDPRLCVTLGPSFLYVFTCQMTQVTMNVLKIILILVLDYQLFLLNVKQCI